MSYDNPLRVSYSFAAIDFGTTKTRYIRGPAGKRGRVVDATLSVTTLFTAVTTPAHVEVGPSGTLTAALDWTLTTNAANSTTNASQQSGAFKTGVASYLAADTDVLITFLAPTGGSPAGVADAHIVIEWF